MTTKLEAAARHALDALEYVLRPTGDFDDVVCQKLHDTAITDLREALAEQANEPDWKAEATALRVNEQNLLAKLAEQQAQQEPVAWLVESKHGNWAPYLEWSEPSYLETQVVTPLYTSPQPAQQETVSDRENAIIRFALHQFMSNAYSHMNAAAQDKDGRRYPLAAVEKFAKDAKDAEALLSRLRFKAPPAPAQPSKPWVGLDQHDIDVLFLNEDGVRFARYIEAKLKEKNT